MYWWFVGCIYLIVLTYQDLKNNMLVDSRHNYFMMGVTFSMIAIYSRGFWYLVGLIALTVIMSIVLPRFKSLGRADVQTLTWIFYGFGIINEYILFYFVLVLIGLTLLYYVLKRGLSRITRHNPSKVPYYPVLLCAFILVGIMYGLY
jgi:hypothetical protein